MGRAPCCEKMGLKKGPWSRDEDQILTSYIQEHGHPNWRALPKHAGLLRCGKSCRLRWTNYLRPDIKRGNFSREEEDTIIHLHEMLGNRWSIIAMNLPGRTDNEIKNVWHTHLKKRVGTQDTTNDSPKRVNKKSKRTSDDPYPDESAVSQFQPDPENNSSDKEKVISIQPSCSESSSVTEATIDSLGVDKREEIEQETFLDDSFWSETLSGDQANNIVESNPTTDISIVEFSSYSPAVIENPNIRNSYIDCHMGNVDLWYDIFTRIEEVPELPEF